MSRPFLCAEFLQKAGIHVILYTMGKFSESKSKILHILADSEMITGEAMSAQLGISRTAVWKQIEQLRTEGYDIAASGKNGYSLQYQEDSLRPGNIWRGLDTAWAGQSMEFHESIASTNTLACERAREGAPHGHVVLSDEQTGGLGRRKRGWHSPKGAGVYLSIVLRPALMPAQVHRVSMAVALAAVRALQILGIEAQIKWPNDIVVGGKKVCGILLQMSGDMDAIDWVVAGLGMNFEAPSLPELREKATGLYAIVAKKPQKDVYVRALLESTEAFVEKALEGDVRAEYRDCLANIGKRVRVEEERQSWEGYAQDIDQDGALLVVDDAGMQHRLLAGDVSVRGLMGYV